MKYLPLATLSAVVGFGMWLADFLIKEAQTRQDIELRLHTTPEDRIKAEEHTKNVEEDFKERMEFQMHVDDMVHELTEAAKEIKEQRKQDSIVRMKDAVTNYQTKELVDSIFIFWKEYNASVQNGTN